MKPIELVGNLAAGAASAVFPPSSMCFGAAMYLINAARGVSASLDAIADLLGVLKDFTVRLKVYNREDLSNELREKLTEILTTVIEIFARSTKVIKDGVLNRLKSFGKNVLLGNDQKMQGLMGKLDKLTESEGRLVGAETLVEAKRTGRNVEAVQVTLTENTIQLSQLTMTQNEMSQGVDQILNAIEGQNAEAQEEKSTKHLETVKKVLKPSVTPQDRYDEIRRDHVHGSGDWVLDEHALHAWVESTDPLLWISGNPGSGKSFLSYTIIKHLQGLNQDQGGAAVHTSVAYFFFRDNNDRTRSFAQALRDVAFQIAQNDQLYAKHVASHTDDDVSSIRSAWQRLFADFFLEDEKVESSAFLLFDGVDEAFDEDRSTFLELLKDIEDAGAASRLHVAMVGRPQIVDEIADHLEAEVPTVYVDWTKNRSDITHYIESSIAKSRVLNRVSKKLKEEIVQTLTSKAGGMFMWVKLMVAELGKKSREGAIKDALSKAPRGLTQMLQHVLEGFSATLTEEDAADLNDMLLWVALAKRPLALGELDAMLRLKTEEGEGVIYLEGKLRKQFASFFVLTRDDSLTTADLQAPKKILVDDEDEAAAGADVEDGLDDVENETDFDSNPATTTVAFSHASISDFFRDPKQGKVTDTGEDHPAVGVDMGLAQLQVTKTCLELIVDGSLLPRMNEAVSLQPYAARNWKEHLEDLDRSKLAASDRTYFATVLSRMLQEDDLLRTVIAPRPYTFFTCECAQLLMSYLTDPDVTVTLPAETVSRIQSKSGNPIEAFECAVQYCAKMWLVPTPPEWNIISCAAQVWAYVQRKEGRVIEQLPTLSAEQVLSAAEWAGFNQTADWHRRVGIVLRENKHFDAALEQFKKALEMDENLWLAMLGISRIRFSQEKYEEALESGEAVLRLAEKDQRREEPVNQWHIQQVHKLMGQCHESILDEMSAGDGGNVSERASRMKLAFGKYKQAFVLKDTDYESLWWCLNMMWSLARLSQGRHAFDESSEASEGGEKHYGMPDIPSPDECYGTIMELVHDLAEAQKDENHTKLTSCLFEHRYNDGELFPVVAMAALRTEQLEWLQGRYRDAIAAARKDRLPVTAASLSLCLAELYTKYGVKDQDADKAIRIWETIATQGASSTKEATDIGWVRAESLNQLGVYCIRKALGDESTAARWVETLERHAHRKLDGASNYLAPSLSAWYVF